MTEVEHSKKGTHSEGSSEMETHLKSEVSQLAGSNPYARNDSPNQHQHGRSSPSSTQQHERPPPDSGKPSARAGLPDDQSRQVAAQK
ncbi:hypothetical protein JTE90_003194 [Oedothorax gibbosus]|uniref:Uncharacterized protein n=1 Tax=Oedothorax gibbosus TaxID=931172 RepID=A0AAV6UNT5_9ARAC|nr:hypothetical protein JTE90_003194 [Oedothorax gibbosus]